MFIVGKPSLFPKCSLCDMKMPRFSSSLELINQSFTKSRLVQHLLACQEIRLTWVWIWDNYAAREPWIITGCRDEIVEYCGEGIRELFRDRRAQRVEKLDCWWTFWVPCRGAFQSLWKLDVVQWAGLIGSVLVSPLLKRFFSRGNFGSDWSCTAASGAYIDTCELVCED